MRLGILALIAVADSALGFATTSTTSTTSTTTTTTTTTNAAASSQAFQLPKRTAPSFQRMMSSSGAGAGTGTGARAGAAASTSTKLASAATNVASWDDLKSRINETPVGKALNDDVALRSEGRGSSNVHNSLRLFDSKEDKSSPPPITLYRDHAGWCPYCQKTMLLVEEKQIPIQISLVPMRSYGDKPAEFMRKVPNGLLPAIEVQGQIITESSVIMELLDRWHTAEDGYRPMMPDEDDAAGRQRYESLARLERELFSWWCNHGS